MNNQNTNTLTKKSFHSASYESIDHYLNLPWSYFIQTKEENGQKIFDIQISELPATSAQGASLEHAMQTLKTVLAKNIQEWINHRMPIPLPLNQQQLQGRISYRTTPENHLRILQEAHKQNLTVSKMVDTLIEKGFKHLYW